MARKMNYCFALSVGSVKGGKKKEKDIEGTRQQPCGTVNIIQKENDMHPPLLYVSTVKSTP
jgi:hypothetical protein